MNVPTLQQRKQEVVERFGPWTAHNLLLEGDLYTIDRRIVGDEIKLRRIVQIVSDLAPKPLADLRVLDLACLEGLYAVELARQGARVVAIEGRESNIARARFAQSALGLDTLELVRDDVRKLSVERHGRFDAVLCLGILYHLDAPDVFAFVERIAEVCRGFAIFDTEISLAADERRGYKGRTYWGRSNVEHGPASTPDERLKDQWASLDNPESFLLTRPSLVNALAHVGFTTVFECHVPPEAAKPRDRITLVAIKGHRQQLRSTPLLGDLEWEDWPERLPPHRPRQKRYVRLLRNVLPARVKDALKQLAQ